MGKRKLDLFGFDIEKTDLYYNARDVNGMFHMDLHTGQVTYMTMSEKEDVEGCQLYRDAKAYRGKIWFSPYSADSILVYDMVLGICEYIDIPKLAGHGRQEVKFCGIYEYEEWFIFVPVEYPAILKVNKETYKIKIIKWEERILKEYPNFLKVNTWSAIAWDYEIVDKIMYLLAENIVIKYNMETDELSCIQISKEGRLYVGIAQYKDEIALVDRMNAELVVWNEKSGNIEKIDVALGYEGINDGNDGCPLGLFKVRNGIVIVQAKADYLLFLDEYGLTHKINLDIKREVGQELLFSYVKQKQGRLIFPLDGQNKLLVVNIDDWSQKCIEMNLEQLDFAQIKSEMERKGCFLENVVCYQLEDFMERINSDGRTVVINKVVDNVGKTILGVCKK